MAEFYDDDVMKARNLRALIGATRKPAPTPSSIRQADESTAKDVANAAPSTPVSPSAIRKADEAMTKDLPVDVSVSAAESPTLSVSDGATREERIAQKGLDRVAAYKAKQEALMGQKPDAPPEDEDYTYDYKWHVFAGGGGEWRLVRFQKYKPVSAGGDGNKSDGNKGDGSTEDTTVVNGGQTTNVDVLKSLLRGMGFTSTLIDSSADFLNRLLKDGLDYDNAIAIFLDSKEFTFKNGQKVTSPFYTAYGYLNEGLAMPKSAADLFAAVEGYKEVVSKYGLSDKFISSDSLKKYVKNNIKVSDLDARANAARLKAINADPFATKALMQLGYIKAPTDLTDFYMNPDIGKETLEQNLATAAFSTEAIRRAQQGIKFDAARFTQLTAGLLGKGLTEEQIGTMASTGFEEIGQQLLPTQKLAGIYEKTPASAVTDIQKELEAEQFLGTASQRRKRLSEMETRAFQRSAGTTTASLRTTKAGAF